VVAHAHARSLVGASLRVDRALSADPAAGKPLTSAHRDAGLAVCREHRNDSSISHPRVCCSRANGGGTGRPPRS
jgi:hypothetical protein